jgi:hypothetical protein
MPIGRQQQAADSQAEYFGLLRLASRDLRVRSVPPLINTRRDGLRHKDGDDDSR